MNSIRHLFFVSADFEVMLEKMDSCENNPEKSFTTVVNKLAPWRFHVFIKCSFDESKNKDFFDRCLKWISKFCDLLKDNVKDNVNFKQKKMVT